MKFIALNCLFLGSFMLLLFQIDSILTFSSGLIKLLYFGDYISELIVFVTWN